MDDMGLGSRRAFRLIAHHPLEFAGLVGLACGDDLECGGFVFGVGFSSVQPLLHRYP